MANVTTSSGSKNILNVCIFTYEGAVDLQRLVELNHPAIVGIEESHLNKNKEILTCLTLKLRRRDGSVVCLRVNAPRIMIHAKHAQKLCERIESELNEIGASYQLNIKACELIITFSSFGNFSTIVEMQERLSSVLIENYESYLKFISSSCVVVHMTGRSTEQQINETFQQIADVLSGSIAAKEFTPIGINYVINNSTYELGSQVSLYELAKALSDDPAFANSHVIYNNLTTHPLVTVITPLDQDDGGETESIWRKNHDVTYTIKPSGTVKQTCPTIRHAEKFRGVLLEAYERVKDRVISPSLPEIPKKRVTPPKPAKKNFKARDVTKRSPKALHPSPRVNKVQ